MSTEELHAGLPEAQPPSSPEQECLVVWLPGVALVLWCFLIAAWSFSDPSFFPLFGVCVAIAVAYWFVACARRATDDAGRARLARLCCPPQLLGYSSLVTVEETQPQAQQP